jgi:glycine reductase complex component B subunit alpha and beta
VSDFELELRSFAVSGANFGDRSSWHDGQLVIDRETVAGLVLADSRVVRVDLDLVNPGEDVRIVHVRDVIQPRTKTAGRGHAYPAIAGHSPETVGGGATDCLEGFAVMICADVPPQIRREVSAAADSLVDMTGPGAVTVYSRLRYLVLTMETMPDLPLSSWNDALREAAHRVADHLASTTAGQTPTSSRRFALPPASGLPKLVHVHTLNASMVPGIGTSIYGYARHALPLLLHPNEILDGAIAGDAVVTYPGSCTWIQVNNPVLTALYDRHGIDFDWLGCIVSRTRWGAAAEKELSAYQTVKLAQMLGAEAALVTWNHGGNDLLEVMLTIQGLEKAGIKSVFLTIESDIKVVRLTPELAETGTNEPPLLFSVPEANAIVSTGTLAPETALPAVSRVVGGSDIVFDQERPEYRTPAAGPLDLEALSGAYSPIFGHFDNYGLGAQTYVDF